MFCPRVFSIPKLLLLERSECRTVYCLDYCGENRDLQSQKVAIKSKKVKSLEIQQNQVSKRIILHDTGLLGTASWLPEL